MKQVIVGITGNEKEIPEMSGIRFDTCRVIYLKALPLLVAFLLSFQLGAQLLLKLTLI